MSIKVAFQNPRTSEVKLIKIGFSWTLFFFASFLGIPLFMRKLNTLGIIGLAIWVVNILGPALQSNSANQLLVTITSSLISIGFNIWLSVKGNEMTARNLLELGWHFFQPDSPEATIARQRWKLMPMTLPPQPASI